MENFWRLKCVHAHMHRFFFGLQKIAYQKCTEEQGERWVSREKKKNCNCTYSFVCSWKTWKILVVCLLKNRRTYEYTNERLNTYIGRRDVHDLHYYSAILQRHYSENIASARGEGGNRESSWVGERKCCSSRFCFQKWAMYNLVTP